MKFGKVAVELFVHERDVTRVALAAYKIGNTVGFPHIGWCGWKTAPDCWYVRFKATTENRNAFLDWVEDEGIELFNPALVR